MASPRSTWSGTVSMEMLAIPVTLANATRDEREQALTTLCTCCNLPVDRTERCPTKGGKPEDKTKGVDLGNGSYRPLAHGVYDAIETATKNDALEILDVQPLSELPLAFATATYYVRAAKDNRAAATSLATLAEALHTTGYGCVVKLCKSAKQDLAVLSCYQGLLLLTVVPFVANFLPASNQERAHMAATPNPAAVERLIALLQESRSPEFHWASYANDGLALRQDAVDAVLATATPQRPVTATATDEGDLMAALLASIASIESREPVAA